MDISALSLKTPSTLMPTQTSGIGAVAKPDAEEGFGNIMGKLVQQVDGLQKSADLSVSDVVAGRTTDIHQVAVKVQEAGVAFDLMLGVRNRLMDCYNELIRMQA